MLFDKHHRSQSSFTAVDRGRSLPGERLDGGPTRRYMMSLAMSDCCTPTVSTALSSTDSTEQCVPADRLVCDSIYSRRTFAGKRQVARSDCVTRAPRTCRLSSPTSNHAMYWWLPWSLHLTTSTSKVLKHRQFATRYHFVYTQHIRRPLYHR